MLRKYIKQGIDNNIMVFDSDSKENELSEHLIVMMIDICIKNYNRRLHTLYIPYCVKIDNDSFKTWCGLDIIRDRGLDSFGEFTEYFRENGGSLYNNHKFIVVGVGDDDTILLGLVK